MNATAVLGPWEPQRVVERWIVEDKSLAEWMSRYIRWSDLDSGNASEEATLLGLAITLIRNEPSRLEPIGSLIDAEWERRMRRASQ